MNATKAVVLTLLVRFIYGYYYGIDFTQPSAQTSAYFCWTVVVAVLVGVIFNKPEKKTVAEDGE